MCASELQERQGSRRREALVSYAGGLVYVCNCNGLRDRDIHAALDQGAVRPADVFRHCGSRPQCAKCVCEIKQMIEAQREAFRYAAE
jgi:bacterioferritin-associated ferredoxin